MCPNFYPAIQSRKRIYFLWLALLSILLTGLAPTPLLAQKSTPEVVKKKKKAKLPPEDITGIMLANAQYNFSPSGLKGVSFSNPTSLQFGPDGRLYVSQQDGLIKILTIVRNGANNYVVAATETISLINQIPNHNDDGSLNPAVTTRQVTGILVKGTAARPLLYVTSSDSRIGGPSGDLNLDTNSGIVSLLSWNGSAWSKLDLVRGLPRSEENHASNGLQLDESTNMLYVAQGGHTNAGSPSTNFAYTSEYALSAAILAVNLTAINALPTRGTGNSVYKYDLPTLDDPDRANNADGSDPFDPFGGNDGLNQAKIDPNGPVRVFSPGYRNPYDLVITKARRMYTIDNGANQGWGGYPRYEGTPNVTNEYVPGEPGSTTPAGSENSVNNLDNLHYIGRLDTYTPGSYYGGHPVPTRANPYGAGLYTHNGTTGVFRTSKTGLTPLPADWPPVAAANSIEGDFQMPGSAQSKALLTFTASTNGVTEYTASNFNGALQGMLLACSYDGNVVKISLTADGANVSNLRNATDKLNRDLPFASNFGSTPLDITVQSDGDVFPGTVWVATYGANAITVFEPQDFLTCTGKYDNNDDDQDGYTNADEIDNASQPCSAASVPPDADHDFVSDLNDLDDDNDGIADNLDYFPLDAKNGLGTAIPLKYDLFNNYPGTGLFGLGFTGLMCNRDSVYSDLYDEDNLIAGGAVGAFSIVGVTAGDALGSLNTQENGFQFGVKAFSAPFTVQGRLLGPFFNNQTPQGAQSQGIYLGTGDQDNYLKIALTANGSTGGLVVVYENEGVPVSTSFSLPNGIPGATLDFFFAVNPATGMVQPKYAANGGTITNLGAPIRVSGPLLTALQEGHAYAVGLIATCRGAAPFTATWDFAYVTADAVTATGAWQLQPPTAGAFTGREENAFVAAGDKFYLLGGRGVEPVQEYNPATKTWTNKAAPPVELHHFQALTLDGLIYAVGAMKGAYPHEVPLPSAYVFNPVANQWSVGTSIPAARRRGSAGAVVYNNKIYLVAGITDGHWAGWVPWFDEYDPATNTWKILPDAPRARDHFSATVIGDKLYLAGGRRSSASTNQTFDLTTPEVDVYDFTTGKWSTLPSGSNLPTPRAGAANGVLGNELLVIGGESSQYAGHKETHALDVTAGTWRRVVDLQESRHGTQAIVNNGGIYVAAGAGNQGGGPLVSSQEAFYLYSPTTPTGVAVTQSKLTAPASLVYGASAITTDNTKTLTLSNTEGNQGVLVTSVAINGAAAYTYKAPYALPFVIPAGKSVDLTVNYAPTTTGETASLVVTHTGQNGTTTTALGTGGGSSTATALFRINAGGGAITTALGPFAADNYFAPALGNTYTSGTPVSSTSGGELYQTERYGNNFGYTFAVSSGQQYRVVLHFAEIYATRVGQRVFDVLLEGNRVLDNYDIYQKAGANKAIVETFTTTVADDALNIDFRSLPEDGGVDNAKISAIEVYSLSPTATPPVANAGPDQSITLPTSSVALTGVGTPASGATITGYAWSQVSGPSAAVFSSKTVASPTVSGLVAGSYTFSLVVTDNAGATSSADQITVAVNAAPTTGGTVAYRINAGGNSVTTSQGVFAADQYYTPTPGYTYSTGSAIGGTANGALYQTERYGTNGAFAYALPVVAGQYTVVLHFAEIYWTAVGQRLFDVSLENAKVLTTYDIYKKAGFNTATTETFSVTVTDGTLNIDFTSLNTGGKESPKVSAIEVYSLSPTATPPVANAGPDQSITLPTSSVALTGVGTPASGATITGYAWSQVSGPSAAVFSSKTVAAPTVSSVVAGSYVFSLVVTDNQGLSSAADQVIITVKPAANQAPVADAGPDQSITLPTNTISLAGSGTDDDGTITAYRWSQISGPNTASLNGASTATLTANNLVAGSYVFSLVVTDNQGLSSAADQVIITVKPAANQAPLANAGPDQSITLPTSSVTLVGTGTDADGTISSYAWSQVSGPSAASLSGVGTTTLTASNLAAGSYVFRLSVTDNSSATASDEVMVTVNPAPVAGPQVVSYTLINADTDQPIRDLVPGDVLNLAALPKNLNIRANTAPATVGSVVFTLSGAENKTETDSAPPYAVFGENKGRYRTWNHPSLGRYTLQGTPYTGASGTGTAGISLLLSFTIINQASAVAAISTSADLTGPADESATTTEITAYPNPSPNGQFRLVLPAAWQGPVRYQLISVLGAQLRVGTCPQAGAGGEVLLDFSSEMMATGSYYLLLQAGKANVRIKLVRQ